jgi:hypothetical protein
MLARSATSEPGKPQPANNVQTNHVVVQPQTCAQNVHRIHHAFKTLRQLWNREFFRARRANIEQNNASTSTLEPMAPVAHNLERGLIGGEQTRGNGNRQAAYAHGRTGMVMEHPARRIVTCRRNKEKKKART